MAKFDVQVGLIGTNGNAFAVLGKVRQALKTGGATDDEINEFMAEATSGDYDHLLGVVTQWVEVY